MDAARIVRKECAVASINGMLFAAVTGAGAALRFGDPLIGTAIGLAIVVDLPVAGASGMPIPLALALARTGVDPAVSAGAPLTTVTDVVAFFAFLALAKAIVL